MMEPWTYHIPMRSTLAARSKRIIAGYRRFRTVMLAPRGKVVQCAKGNAYSSLVRSQAPPAPSWSIHPVKVHRETDSIQDAFHYEKLLQEVTHLPSSDATDAMEGEPRRKSKPTVLSDYVLGTPSVVGCRSYSAVIHYSRSPSPLKDHPITCSSFIQTHTSTSIVESVHSVPGHPNEKSPKGDHCSDDRAAIQESLLAMYDSQRKIKDQLQTMQGELSTLRLAVVGKNEYPLPVRTLDELRLFNRYLMDNDNLPNIMRLFVSMVARTPSKHATNILRFIMTDDVAAKVNWKGTRGRYSMERTPITQNIMRAVVSMFGEAVVQLKVEHTMQYWFHKAQRRLNSKGQKNGDP